MKHEPMPRTALRRVSAAVANGVLAAAYGSPLGLMFLAGELSQGQYDACTWFVRVRADYDAAVGARLLRGQDLSSLGVSSPVDPDTAKGQRIAKREERAVRTYDAVKLAMGAGDKFKLFERIVCLDLEPETGQKPIIRTLAAALLKYREHGKHKLRRIRRAA